MPTTELSDDDFTDGEISVVDVMLKAGIIKSKGEGRRLVEQGGVSVDDEKISGTAYTLKISDFEKGHVILKKGKKVFHKIIIK